MLTKTKKPCFTRLFEKNKRARDGDRREHTLKKLGKSRGLGVWFFRLLTLVTQMYKVLILLVVEFGSKARFKSYT